MADRVERPTEAVRRLGHPQLAQPPADALGIRVEDHLEPIERGLPVTGGQPELGVEALPVRVGVGEERLRNGPEPAGKESQGGHRRLDQPVLEGADVGLRVARLGQLALGQARSRPGGLQASADLLREIAILGGKARSLPRLAGDIRCHARDHTRLFKWRLTRYARPWDRAPGRPGPP